jgi:L-ascorbate metabolism protein UlaG (beta-lactamase superfamily)
MQGPQKEPVLKFTLIRNATVIIETERVRVLMDPYLAAKGESGVYGGPASLGRSPLVDLPWPAEDILRGIDAVLLTHIHEDHFDKRARELVPHSLPVLCAPENAAALEAFGFEHVIEVGGPVHLADLLIDPTSAAHGPDEVLFRMGHVNGYLLRQEVGPTVYFASDTILTEEVRSIVEHVRPQIIVTNSGGAFTGGTVGPIIMDARQTVELAQLAPWAEFIAIHLDATDHGTVSRSSLREYVEAEHADISHRLHIPHDGQTYDFSTTPWRKI